MAGKLRVIMAGGWYHVVNRGNRREAIFRTDTDRRRFLGRVAELAEVYREIPGLKYPAAAAVKRFGRVQADDPATRQFVQRLRSAPQRWPSVSRMS